MIEHQKGCCECESCGVRYIHTGEHHYCLKHSYKEKPNSIITITPAEKELPTGWQCPICKGVMAPFIMECLNCRPEESV